MNLYSAGIGAPASSWTPYQRIPRESKRAEARQSRMALSLHRKREGERFAREAGSRGRLLVGGGIAAGLAVLFFATRKKRA